MIEVRSVSKTIKNNEVLKNINLNFQKGKAYLLRGHNGSGKTMMLRLLCGLIMPTTGIVEINKKCSFGIMIETPTFIENKSAIYNLKYLAGINNKISMEDIYNSLKQVQLYKHKNEKVNRYSLGMKQRLGVCQAIMENPDVLLLDEPFNALDDDNYKNTLHLLNVLKGEGKTLVVAAHDQKLTQNPLFDEIIVLDNGKVKQNYNDSTGS